MELANRFIGLILLNSDRAALISLHAGKAGFFLEILSYESSATLEEPSSHHHNSLQLHGWFAMAGPERFGQFKD